MYDVNYGTALDVYTSCRATSYSVFCVLLPNLEEHDRLHPHDAAMIADRGERDDDGANNNHENAMDGDDTPKKSKKSKKDKKAKSEKKKKKKKDKK